MNWVYEGQPWSPEPSHLKLTAEVKLRAFYVQLQFGIHHVGWMPPKCTWSSMAMTPVPLPGVQFATHNILHAQATQLYTLESPRKSIHKFSKDFNNYKQLAIKAFHFLSRCSLWLVKPYANMDILYTTIIDRISQPHVHKTIPRLVDYGMCTYLKWFQHRHWLQEGLVYLPLKKPINTKILNI